MLEDHYKTLGVGILASDKEIRNAYKRLSMRYHPDKNHGSKEHEEKFKRIAIAYSVIGDREKRRDYDKERVMSFIPHCRNAVQVFIFVFYITVLAITMYVSEASITEKITGLCTVYFLYKLPELVQSLVDKYQKFREEEKHCGNEYERYDVCYWLKFIEKVFQNRREKEEESKKEDTAQSKENHKVDSMNKRYTKESGKKDKLGSTPPRENVIGSKLEVDQAENLAHAKNATSAKCF
ncbi:MAG: J domain-containing protein [Aaplasma endosymbiont of Hyalomma asiaticum]